ncbi:hypothetical protein B296_00052994, partial [Ensete ventricosum]
NVNLGTSLGDLAERVNSGTNPGDLAEKMNSGTNPGDSTERVNSGTNPGDSAERVNSGTNPGDSAEKVNAGTNPGDLAERVNSGTNPGDLVERSVSESVGRLPTTKVGNPATPYLSDEEFILVSRLKGILSSSCAIKEITKLWLVKGGLSLAESDEGGTVLHPAIFDLGYQDSYKEMKARWRGLKNSTKELDALKSRGGPEAIAKAEERASELEQELEKTKRERDEVLQRLEASKKELSEVRSNLAEIQRLLKEVRVRAQKMDDELLQSVKALENA